MSAKGAPESWSLPTEKILRPEEIQRILETARKSSERDFVFFVTCAETGLRLSEVAHIMIDDLKPDGRLEITRRKKKVLKPQIIDISAKLRDLLRSFIGTRDLGYIFPGRSKPCFIHRRSGVVDQVCIGGHASLRDVQRKFKEALMRTGLEMYGRGIHTTRHFAITQFYQQFRDLRAAQLFAGHSSSTITERYAAVLDMKEKIEAKKSLLP